MAKEKLYNFEVGVEAYPEGEKYINRVLTVKAKSHRSAAIIARNALKKQFNLPKKTKCLTFKVEKL